MHLHGVIMAKTYSMKQAAGLAIFTAVLTLLLKFSAYFLTNSIGLLSDALETLINIGSGLMLFWVLSIIAIPADANHNYGHYKAEYFAAGVEGCLISISAAAIIYSAVLRLYNQEEIQQIPQGVVISIIATLINVITAKLMQKVGKAYDSIALEASAKHIMADVWTSVCIFIGLLIIFYAPPSWSMIDPILAIMVALHISNTGFKLLKRAVDGLMDVTLPANEITIIKQAITSGLKQANTDDLLTFEIQAETLDTMLRDFRTRKSGSRRFVEFKLLLPGELTVHDSHKICDAIESCIAAKLQQISINIHVEPLIVDHH